MRALFSLLGIVLLMGCHERIDYLYLLRHPQVLEQKYTYCQMADEKDAAFCKTVNQAAGDFAVLFNQRRMSPEDFGQQVLKVQMELSQISILVEQLRHSQTEELQKKELLVKEKEQALKQKLAGMFAVIDATSSPESM